jgi:vanillate O-demethylase monooxygenase subunit
MTALRSKLIAGAAPAPKDHWYGAAFDREVGDKPFARKILGKDLVFFRDGAGVARALDNRCAHRAAPLSNGKIVEGAIQCSYHGIRFDGSGKCLHIPSQPAIPGQMRVRSYPLVEKCGFLWIWMGDEEAADPSLVPDFSGYGAADSTFFYEPMFMMDIGANYQLLQENLLDTTHVTFLHEGMLDGGAMATTIPTVKIEGNRVVLERSVEEVFTGTYAANFMVAEGKRYRRLLTVESWAPAVNIYTNHLHDLDDPSAPVLINHGIFAITPGDDRSCHQFFAMAKNYGDPFPEWFGPAVWDLFLTDKTMLEEIQRTYDKFGPATPDVSVLADGGALQYRRVLEGLLKNENEELRVVAG